MEGGSLWTGQIKGVHYVVYYTVCCQILLKGNAIFCKLRVCSALCSVLHSVLSNKGNAIFCKKELSREIKSIGMISFANEEEQQYDNDDNDDDDYDSNIMMMTMRMVTMAGNMNIISHPGMACVDEKEKDGQEWSFHHSCLHVPWLRFVLVKL